MLTQVLNAPRKSIKNLITNEAITNFTTFLYTLIACIIKRISISAFR